MVSRFRGIWQEYPSNFRALILASFVDRLGATMIFPFFALYVTQKFDVGMTEAGMLIAIFAVMGFIGSLIGGALADRFGRRGIVIFSLIFSALSSISMGLVNDLYALYALAVFVGLLSDIGSPARGAMVADLLPKEKQTEGFGVLRVAGNLAWIVGPIVGGLLAVHSFLLLFILDAISSLITAGIFYWYVPETKPEIDDLEERQSIFETLLGYRIVFRDRIFVLFIGVSITMLLAYLQMYSTLSVYLRDVHGISARGYGLLMSINATVVVIFQFWLTRRIKRYPQLLMMSVGAALYMVGFTLFGFVTTFVLFTVAMLIITVGEMIAIPVGQAVVAGLAPTEMRGRYMATYGLAWMLPAAIGPWAAGLIMDQIDPNLVWYLAGLLSAFAVVGYYLLFMTARERLPVEPTSETEPAIST
jgi:MFS family permease